MSISKIPSKLCASFNRFKWSVFLNLFLFTVETYLVGRTLAVNSRHMRPKSPRVYPETPIIMVQRKIAYKMRKENLLEIHPFSTKRDCGSKSTLLGTNISLPKTLLNPFPKVGYVIVPSLTPPKFNIAPENEGTSNHHLSGAMFNFGFLRLSRGNLRRHPPKCQSPPQEIRP